MKWYDHYQFDNEQQYLNWKLYAEEVLKREGMENEMLELELLWVLHFPLPAVEKKKGQLPLF